MPKPKHGWNSLEDYLRIHERVLRQNESYMIVPKTYVLEKFTEQYWSLKAENIRFRTFKGNEVRVDILKDIEIDSPRKGYRRARTFDYTYSANYPKATNPLIRYCSPHHDRDPSKAPDHHKFHHKHDFTSGTEQIIKIAPNEYPHVSEFLLEVLQNF